MSFYDDKILPHMINLACGTKPILKQRQKVVPQAEGRILEIGMGSGINIPYYNPEKVEKVWGLEPSDGMREKARERVAAAPFELEWLGLPGEEIPLDDDSADTIVLTYTLCTIPDWRAAVKQMRRVLKPGGKLLFSEHGRAPDEAVRKWQNRINPLWMKMAGGCHLNRDIPKFLREGGFKLRDMETLYVPSTPKVAGFTYWGYAN
ncbi:class I SAM-dependent methyltransferase [Pseudomaricurvus alkylphenolicus]|jgi:ubiquinone/menaquinone biosynthesis C-methylase UbiE|uniref:class I SAM-dependent methyltransferase n=1 Tax=Pseudomaricurvus alkylphenolicus TaxID=1306991 RepID=UPI00141DFED5|nr:class I SAM-dependent methyltransferase [Pseudomaricurvus alkylphenolicus]NIB43360.1 class I SAM-dependent methyltransferase [Pseudomaricurvus alkylphenolicus]